MGTQEDAEEIILSFGDLHVGKLYPILSATKEQRKFDGKIVDSVKIDISTCEFLKTYTYLPTGPLKFALDNIDVINQAAIQKKPFSACYYGAIVTSGRKGEMRRYIGKVHAHNVGVNAVLLEDVQSKCKKVDDDDSRKRSSSDLDDASGSSQSPAKLAKSDQ